MKAVYISKPGGNFEVVERPIPQPGSGDFILCQFGKVTGISFGGGYAEYMVAPAEAVAAMPDDLPVAEAAPLLCTGITVFNSLRNSGVRPDDTVAVQGIGGLGHLGIQYARQMGFRTVAVIAGLPTGPQWIKILPLHPQACSSVL
jgi:alcohol dehydrogenase/propanol-preferring alcohol dehydrogenase